jgi:hypothetical protein
MSELPPNPATATPPPPPLGDPSDATAGDSEIRAAQTLVQLMAGTVASQLTLVGATTAKLVGILTFDGAVAALIIANQNNLNHWALLSLLPLLVSIGACAYGLRSTTYGAAPRADAHEVDIKNDIRSGEKFYIQIMQHLRAAQLKNEAAAKKKATLVSIAVWGFTAAPLILVVVLCLSLLGVIQNPGQPTSGSSHSFQANPSRSRCHVGTRTDRRELSRPCPGQERP